MLNKDNHDIVISGAGLVTCLGRDRESTWQAVIRGQCGIMPLTAIESPLDPNLGGGEVRDPDLGAGVDLANPREAHLLQLAFNEACTTAGLNNQESDLSMRYAVVLGTSLHGMRNGGAFLRTRDTTALQSFLAGAVVPNIVKNLSHVAMTTTTCSACSSGLASISLGCTLLQTNQADIVIAGGYDPISEYAYGGFNSMRLVSDTTLRPFAHTRNGMKLAEAYAIVILERAQHALARNAKPLARIIGFGESCDAFHLSKPHPEGSGAAQAMRQAISAAHLDPEDIDLLVAHATATPDNDASEHAALAQVFGKCLPDIPIVGFKSHLGHSLGAAGAVDLILAALAIRDQMVPPCANITTEDSEFSDLQVSCGRSATQPIRYVLNTSLGFGGANSCMILAAPKTDPHHHISTATDNKLDGNKFNHDVVITGIGVVLPAAIGNDAFVKQINNVDGQVYDGGVGTIPAEKYEHLINARRTRRMSEYAKLCLAATSEAYRDAGIEDVPDFGAHCAALVATTHAASHYCESYYQQLIDEGINSVNPILFAEGVPNVASAHLSTTFSIKGFCQTLIGTRTAGLEALHLAAARIRAEQWDRVVVVAVEETTDIVTQAYCDRFKKLYGNRHAEEFSFASGAITFILERGDLAKKRQATIRATLAKTAASYATNPGASARIRTTQRVIRELGKLDTLFSSGNGHYLDRIDAAAVRHFPHDVCRYVGADTAITERFSVGPLASLSAAMMMYLPSAGVICSDYYGGVYGTKIQLTTSAHK